MSIIRTNAGMPMRRYAAIDFETVEKHHSLLKPPRKSHWPKLTKLLTGVERLSAHNASFDKSVLNACCASAGVSAPTLPFECTVKLARATWDIFPTRLPDVCDHLRINLKHHEALSDALACAKIVIEARRAGARV